MVDGKEQFSVPNGGATLTLVYTTAKELSVFATNPSIL